MKTFSIVHLSDLHIYNSNNEYPESLKKLIDDIVEQTKEIDKFILVVTGDIIDQARFDTVKDIALSFFKDLNAKTENKIIDLFFAPGNHDRERTPYDIVILDHLKSEKITDLDSDEFIRNNLPFHLSRFDKFLNFIEEVYVIFELKQRKELCFSDYLEIDDCKLRINVINTSWISQGGVIDEGNLVIGEYQFDKIESDWKRLEKDKGIEHIDLSITMMHHPITWLRPKIQDEAIYRIRSNRSMNSDIILRGHTHNRMVENYFDLNGSTTTLVTGMGKQRTATKDDQNELPQRYSIYTFQCDFNIIEIVMRNYVNGKFSNDYTAYLSEVDSEREKLHFPIRKHMQYSDDFITMPLINDVQPIYPSKEVLDQIINNSQKLISFKEQVNSSLNWTKLEMLSEIERSDPNRQAYINLEQLLYEDKGTEDFQKQERELIRNLLDEKNIVIKEAFISLLFDICYFCIECFFEDAITGSNKRVRVHFRLFDKESDTHKRFITVSKSNDKFEMDDSIKSAVYGQGLTKHSFDGEKLLVYSLNRKYAEQCFDNEKWKDYLTYAPKALSIKYKKKGKKQKKEERPMLSFGITVDSEECANVLQTLCLIKLDVVIKELLCDFLESFEIDVDDLYDFCSNTSIRDK